MICFVCDVDSTFDESKKYDFMIVYDDDITAVLGSMATYKKIKQTTPDAKPLIKEYLEQIRNR